MEYRTKRVTKGGIFDSSFSRCEMQADLVVHRKCFFIGNDAELEKLVKHPNDSWSN